MGISISIPTNIDNSVVSRVRKIFRENGVHDEQSFRDYVSRTPHVDLVVHRLWILPRKKIPSTSPNPFIAFRNYSHLKVILKNGGMENRALSKVMGALWKCMTPEMKQPWVDLGRQ